MPGPLHGIKVLDLTIFINGPSATGQMCEQGAEVLKVEPSIGDAMRLGKFIYFFSVIFTLIFADDKSFSLSLSLSLFFFLFSSLPLFQLQVDQALTLLVLNSLIEVKNLSRLT
tara:strand:- start:101 stop:439 length:339 start_codon:yes stop_codon:yes gene_type:complete